MLLVTQELDALAITIETITYKPSDGAFRVRWLWHCLFSLVVMILISLPAGATTLILDDSTRSSRVSEPFASWQPSPDETPTPEEVLTKAEFDPRLYKDTLKPGPDSYWYRIELVKPAGRGSAVRYYIEFNNPIITHIDVYVYRQQKLLHTARLGSADFDAASVSNRLSQSLALDIEPGEKLTVLIRKQSNSPGVLPVTVFSGPAFEKHTDFQYLLWGGVIALLIVIAIYNAVIYLLVRSRSYIWYLLFYGLCFVYFSGLHGFGRLLWPEEMYRWLTQNILTMNFVLLGVVLNFAAVFLEAWRTAPTYYKWMHTFSTASAIGFVLALIIPEYHLIPVFGVLQAIGSVYAMSMAYAAYRNDFYPARFFLLSWSFVLVGAAVGFATFNNLIPANWITIHAFFLGTLCELILLSVALADRLRYSEKLAMASAFIDPRTWQPNYSYFKSQYFKVRSEDEANSGRCVMLLVHLGGVRDVLGLLGPMRFEQVYRQHIERIDGFLRNSTWSLPFVLPDKRVGHMISLPSNHLIVIARLQPNLESVLKPLLLLADSAIRVDKLESKLSLTIGIAEFDPKTLEARESYRRAQIALLNCEANALDWCEYEPQQDANLVERLTLLVDLRKAIDQDGLSIHLQPQFHIQSNALVGAEVLVRWQHADKGMISPAQFIPLAEDAKLIHRITELVIDKAFRWLSTWEHRPAGFHLSINLSVIDLQNTALLDMIRAKLNRYQISSGDIVFEVTESAVMHDDKAFLDTLTQLREAGFGIALDDFGTGYSSMRYMQQMNPDTIKIDRSFIRDINQNPVNRKIVTAIIQMALSTNARTVAEGIETQDELNVLQSLGANTVQGFLLGKPQAPELFEAIADELATP